MFLTERKFSLNTRCIFSYHEQKDDVIKMYSVELLNIKLLWLNKNIFWYHGEKGWYNELIFYWIQSYFD